MEGSRFDLGYCLLDRQKEHVFLSVTEGFEHGPGIHRDGVTEPWMLDPHDLGGGATTTHAQLQRAGTWTIYHHLKAFDEALGDSWTIVGAQSNGDLTMNPWHVAFLGSTYAGAERRQVCGLFLEENGREPVGSRWYRCFVKWNREAAMRRGTTYEFLDLRPCPAGGAQTRATLRVHPSQSDELSKCFYGDGEEISEHVSFALAGKPVIERRHEISPPNVIDRFQDVRHIFNIPAVATQEGRHINLGEYQLFNNLNERRAALNAPVLIDLELKEQFSILWEPLEALLITERHFEKSDHSPTRRGQFRWYPADRNRPRVEIFFQPAVYPFGALGMRPVKTKEVVSLSCGGLSGRLGNTLEAISRMLYDFFACDDAIILDEGLDVCLIVNDGHSNKELLHKVWSFTRQRFLADDKESRVRPARGYEKGAASYPLNSELAAELKKDFRQAADYADVFRVMPGRAQLRSMLIFARPKE